ncbi:hypothetical protein L873DRAFT_1682137, partial [Choiromyces venosus 120613-1]
DSTHEFVTGIEGICTDRTAFNPTFILKAKQFLAKWFKKVKGDTRNVVGCKKPQLSCLISWHHSIQILLTIASIHKAAGKFRLLIFDGHSCHVNIKFLEFCIS